MNKKLVILPFLMFLLLGCNSDVQGGNQNPGNNDSNPGGIIDQNNTETAKITFKNGGFTGDFTNSNKDAFITWFNSKADILSSIEFTGYAQINEISTFTTFILGSSKNGCNFTMNFTKEIKSIKFVLQAYYNSYSYTSQGQQVTGFSVDENSRISFNNSEYISLADTTDSVPTEIEHTLEMNNAKTLTMKNEGLKERALVHSMEITYIK